MPLDHLAQEGGPGAATGSSLLQCDVPFLTMLAIIAAITYYCYSALAKSSRARREADCAGMHQLPSPTPVLPRWLGFLGGHTLQISREEMVPQLEGWADEFGGDYELSLFGKKTIVVTNAADCRRVLSLRPSKFARGLTPTQFQWAAEKLGFTPSMFFDEGKQWGRGRRIIAPSLNGHNVTAMIPIMTKIGERFCAKLGAHADNDEVVDASNVFARFTHDIIALAAFGFDANSIEATKEKPCTSYESMDVIFSSLLALIMQPLAM